MPRMDRSRSTPAPVDPPPMTTTPVVVSGIQQKGERTTWPFPLILPGFLRLRARADCLFCRLFLDPMQRPLHRLLPTRQSFSPLLLGGLRLEDFVHLPVVAQLVEGAPEAGR